MTQFVQRMIRGGTSAPPGPSNNMPGVPMSTSPTAPASLGRRQQRDLTIATLLGQAAQAVEPTGIGARLGAFGEQVAGAQRFETALARSLAGEELTQGDLQGLGPEQVGQIMSLSEQAERRRAARAKRLEESKGAELDQRAKGLSILQQAAESGWSDERLQSLAEQLGIDAAGVDFKSATERAKELIAARAQGSIDVNKAKTPEELTLMARQNEYALEQISARGAADLASIRARVGDNPEQLARYNLALETVATYFRALGPDALVEPAQVSMLIEDALRAVGANEILGNWQAARAPLHIKYLDDPDFKPDQAPDEGISQQELRQMYGPPKAGNPYNPNDPIQLVGYSLFQSGMKEDEIAPILLGLAARKRSTPTTATAESTGASGR